MRGDQDSQARHRRDDQHSRARRMLEDQSRAIDALIAELLPLDPDGEDVLVRVPLLMLQAVGVSLRSVLRLTEMRDMSVDRRGKGTPLAG
ncbi:hypothetical protein MOP88_01300 [Sphingomonas sp. WKB10]|nr:hypothetical protein [Sphingomonas sp. WKB10]